MIEDTLHALRDCSVVKRIWSELLPSVDYDTFFSLPLREWVFHNLKTNSQKGSNGKWACIFGVALWRIWHWRNKYVFEGSVIGVANMFLKV